ncbi:MAG: YHS domain-containing (seleno)protein [Bosea sp. (in: a-proteobacteria)]
MMQRSTAMPAKARRHCGFGSRLAAIFLASLLNFGAEAARAGLPEGLPDLPKVGEGMMVSRVSGLALGGYDAISYHVSGEAKPGLPQFEASWRGLAWRFATEANRAAFLADPESFVPLFEGLDPVGVARARIVEADPYLFTIHRGRLVLFRTPDSRSRFLDDPRLARDASTHWPDVARQLSR